MHDASNGRARPGTPRAPGPAAVGGQTRLAAGGPARLAAAVLLLGGLAACAPQNTATTFRSGEMGRAAAVSFGTVVGLRPVTVQGSSGGIGTAAGAVAGGLGGSFIGGDPRSNIIAGLGGALIGGLAGNALERGATRGQAVEFFIRRDEGGDISVVQTNEEGLQAGDRVVISFGANTRLSRAAGAPPGVPPGAYAPPGGAPGAAYGAPGYGGAAGYGALAYGATGDGAPPYGAPGYGAPASAIGGK